MLKIPQARGAAASARASSSFSSDSSALANALRQRAHALDLLCRQRLLEELEVERGRLGEEAQGLLDRITLVRVCPDPDSRPDPLAQPAEPFHVLREIEPDLDLQDAEPARQVLLGFREGFFERLDADRDRRRERFVRAPEHFDERKTALLRREIVQGHVHRGAGGRSD